MKKPVAAFRLKTSETFENRFRNQTSFFFQKTIHILGPQPPLPPLLHTNTKYNMSTIAILIMIKLCLARKASCYRLLLIIRLPLTTHGAGDKVESALKRSYRRPPSVDGVLLLCSSLQWRDVLNYFSTEYTAWLEYLIQILFMKYYLIMFQSGVWHVKSSFFHFTPCDLAPRQFTWRMWKHIY